MSRVAIQIIQLLSEKVHIAVPSVETDLMETGLLDSLTLVSLIAGLEEEFSITIPFEDIEIDNFRSVARLVELVRQLKEPTMTARASAG